MTIDRTDPAHKYRDRVDPEHRMAMEAIGLARMLLDQHRARFETLLASRQHMDNVGFVLDPTLYRDMINSRSFALQERMVKAALAFLREVEAVAGEIQQGEAA